MGKKRAKPRKLRQPPDSASRPTAQRRLHGTWADPQGSMKSQQPCVDMASDAVGHLFIAKLISSSQEQAARLFQKLRLAYMAEFPEISGFKSCLDGAISSHDEGDGNKAVMDAYRDIEKKLTRPQRSEVLRVCDAGEMPSALELLRSGLNAIAA